MLCDIGNGTMNVMYINECRPLAKKCFTEKYGTNQCMLAVRENLMKQFACLWMKPFLSVSSATARQTSASVI
jgi:hypothetical protein